MIYTVTLNPCLDRTLTVKQFRVGGTFQVAHSDLLPAGKGINVARVVATLGEPVIALGWVGEDDAALFAAALARAGIGNRLLGVPGITRTNVTILDPEGHTETHLREPGLTPPPDALTRLKAELRRAAPGDWIVFAGSLPPSLPADTYRTLIRLCADQGAYTLLDSSGPALLCGVAAPPTLLKPNAFELWQIDHQRTDVTVEQDINEGSIAEVLAAARRLRTGDKGVAMVVVSLGKKGALGLDRQGHAWHAQTFLDVPTVDTVGSGDALAAGLVTALARGVSFRGALRLGVACGAANALVAGAGRCRKSDIERLAVRVSVEVLQQAMLSPR